MSMSRTKNKNEPYPFCGNDEIGVGYNETGDKPYNEC